jgi:Transposase DDE domain
MGLPQNYAASPGKCGDTMPPSTATRFPSMHREPDTGSVGADLVSARGGLPPCPVHHHDPGTEYRAPKDIDPDEIAGRHQVCPIGIKLRGKPVARWSNRPTCTELPMPSICTIVDTLQHAITETASLHARSSGFCQRASKLDAATFCQGLILGWLERPEASLAQLAQMLASCGVPISPQGLDQRFSPAAARLLQQVLEAVAKEGMPATSPVPLPLLQRFTAVEIDDSSIVSLPATLATLWKGSGGSGGGEAAVKLQVRLDLLWGSLLGPFLQDGKGPDKDAPMHDAPIVAGSLRIADLGYFSLRYLRRRTQADASWMSRYHPQTSVYLATGVYCRPLELAAQLAAAGDDPIDWEIELGKRERLPCRLLAIRVPEDVAAARRERLRKDAQRNGTQVSAASLALATWSIAVTNAALSVAEAFILLRARWQIEQLFRRWKDQGKIDESRSQNPWRILCELYAKLIACVLQHWLTVERCWSMPERSLTKAAQVVRDRAILLAVAFPSRRRLGMAIRTIHDAMAVACRLNPRCRHPNTYQTLQSPSLETLA